MTVAEAYAARVDAMNAQRARLRGPEPPNVRWGPEAAQRFRYDPHRSLDPNLEVIASYVHPEDVVIDAGGGAGRVCLPMALRCREGIVVDASSAMQEVFEACAAEAGITNARFVLSDWLEAGEMPGDIVVAASVTYFVRDIVRFVEKLQAAARRRVLITVRSVPGPNQSGELFNLVYGETQEEAPGYRELLPVLWEMGILPDVRVLPLTHRGPGRSQEAHLAQTRGEAIELALQEGLLRQQDQARAREMIENHYDDLFAVTTQGIRPLWHMESRELLITWETHQGL